VSVFQKRRRRLRTNQRDRIQPGDLSIAQWALELEIEWLRAKKWTDREIQGLWDRLIREFEHTQNRVKGRMKRGRS
jgi:ABC-type uncharacterized transport system auxiliary subunit